MYDDFESGSNGAKLSSQVRTAKIGTWRDVSSRIGSYCPTYSNLNAHSGSLAMRSDWGSGGDGQEGARWAAPTISTASNEFYFSFWVFIPSGQNVPGQIISSPNWKLYWLSTNDVFQNDYVAGTGSNNLPGTFYPVSWLDGSQNRAGLNYMNVPFIKGRWARWEVYVVGSTTNGSVAAWYTDSANKRYLMGSATGRTLDNGTTGWGYLHIPGYGRYDTNSNTYYDDIYVATGPGAQARAEIGNASTYSNCTNLAVCSVTSWSSTSITATMRTGSFSSGQAYLYVIDSSGAANTTGFPITLGQAVTPDTTPPSKPTGVSVQIIQ